MDGFKAAEREYREKAGTTTTNGWGSGLLEDVGRTIEDRLGKESDARQLVTVETRGSTDITDLLKTGAVGAAWRGEGGTVSESGQPSLVERKYSHGMIYALPKTTEESLDDLFFDVEAMLIDTAIEDFGEEESAVIFNGNGTNKPKGIFNETFSLTANTFGEIKYHASGIANAITDGTNGDIFIDMQADLHKRYEKSGKWIMHRKTLAEIRKMKNSNGDYIYQQALTDGTPQQILEREISLQEDMPLIGADAYPVAFGDMKKFYKLFPIVGLRLTRDETSDYGHVLYYIRRRLAGGVYDPRAVQFLKCEV